jgi:malate dehydrogenase
MLGPSQPVVLHLLDIPPAEKALAGVRMELIDAAFPLLAGIVTSVDAAEASKGVDYAIMVGGFPRKAGMERKDVMSKNVAIYQSQAAALEAHASKDVKILVVANPANTNALILSQNAPSIPKKNITCLTRLDHNRAQGQISEKISKVKDDGTSIFAVSSKDVRNVIIWGNHSSTQVPDATHATVTVDGKAMPAKEAVNDDAWLEKEFVETVQQRGAAVIAARGASSALSAASAAVDHMRDWALGTEDKDAFVSMGVFSDGSSGYKEAPEGVVFSFPVKCSGDGEWEVVKGLSMSEETSRKVAASGAELVEERELALECLKG